MNQDEVESQLSAMFDGELPAAECELLSRRIDRDDNLRARWSRYALIGAAMRSEPVATARTGFAQRVSSAIEAAAPRRRLRRGGSLLWSGALAATLVAAVAGLGVSMLRDAAQGLASAPVAGAAVPTAAVAAAATPAVASMPSVASVGAGGSGFANEFKVAGHGPLSYVTPAGTPGAATMLRTQLADYIVAHSAYSNPLLRRNVLSELVTSEDQMGIASATQSVLAGGGDAIGPVSGTGR